MKVLLINNQHAIKGGAHNVYFNTAELLKKYGHDVFFFSTQDTEMIDDENKKYFPKGVDYRKLNIFNKIKATKTFIYNDEAYDKITAYIKLIKPDIAHVHLFMGGLTVSVLKALKENNIPIVHTVHDYRLICPAYTFLDKNNNVCTKCRDGFFIRCAYKKCSAETNFYHSSILSLDAYSRKYLSNPLQYIDSYIFVSYFAQDLHIHFDERFKKSEVIYNFNTVKKVENSNKGDYILYFGRLSREKGIKLLVEVAKALNLKLKIVGNGPLYKALKESTVQSPNIEILGFKIGNELLDIIQNCSFVCVPSEWYENNPLSIIESFSLGKPVIGSDIGGIPELLEDNRGLLFKTKDYISLKNCLIKATEMNYNEYLQLSQNVLKYAQSGLSEETHINKLIDVYESVITLY